MRFRFLDEQYDIENYRKLKLQVLNAIDTEIKRVAVDPSFLSENHLNKPEYSRYENKVYFYLSQGQEEVADDIANKFKEGVKSAVYEDIRNKYEDPSEIEQKIDNEDVEMGKVKINQGLATQNVYVKFVPIKEEYIQYEFGEASPQVSVEGDRNNPGDLSGKFLPTFDFGVFYKGEEIQSAYPNSPSGKTGMQSTHYKKGTHPGAVNESKRMYLRSSKKPSTALHNALRVIYNSKGLEYKVVYERTINGKKKREDKNYVYVKNVPLNSSIMGSYIDKSGELHNYHQISNPKDIPLIGEDNLTNNPSNYYRADLEAFKLAIHDLPSQDKSKNETDKENTAFQSKSTGLREEIFTEWLDTTIDKEVNKKVMFIKPQPKQPQTQPTK